MNIFLYSKKHLMFQLIHMCPECKKFLSKLHYHKGDGTKISQVELASLARKATLKTLTRVFLKDQDNSSISEMLAVMAECPKCGKKWPIYAGGKPPEAAQEPHITDVEVTETHRTEEGLGAEQREIDNSKSSIELERRFTVSKEWSKSVIIEEEKARKTGAELTVGLSEAASIKAASEEALKSKYTTSEETKQTYTEEIVLKVPSKTKLLVVFKWKRIWQHGIIALHDEKGFVSKVPFKVVVGITFDQTQVDQT